MALSRVIARQLSVTFFADSRNTREGWRSLIVSRQRNPVKKIPNLAKKIAGSGKYPAITGNKLLRFLK